MAATTDEEERAVREAAAREMEPQVKPTARACLRPAIIWTLVAAAAVCAANLMSGMSLAHALKSAVMLFVLVGPGVYGLWLIIALGQLAERTKKRIRSEMAAAKMRAESDSALS